MKNAKRYAALFVCALAAVACVRTGTAGAYFTAYTTAAGGYDVVAKEVKMKPEEDVDGLKKTILIENTGEVECWARLKVFNGDAFDITYTHGEEWTQGEDGYWYYSEILQPGEKTASTVVASIAFKEEIDRDEFMSDCNVVVVTECTPVLYDATGKPYARWDLLANEEWKVDVGEDGKIEEWW